MDNTIQNEELNNHVLTSTDLLRFFGDQQDQVKVIRAEGDIVEFVDVDQE